MFCKKILTLSVFFLLLFSCKNSNDKPTPATIELSLNLAEGESVKKLVLGNSSDYDLSFSKPALYESQDPNEVLHTFFIRSEIISDGANFDYLFAPKGSKLSISLSKDRKKWICKGDFSKENETLLNEKKDVKILVNGTTEEYRDSKILTNSIKDGWSEPYAREPVAFEAFLKDWKTKAIALLHDKNLSSDFVTFIEREIQYLHTLALIRYPSYHKMYTKKEVKNFKAGEDAKSGFDMNDATAIHHPNFLNVLNEILDLEAKAAITELNFKNYSKKYIEIISSKITAKEVKSILFENLLSQYLSSVGADDYFLSIYEGFKKEFPDVKIENLEKAITKIKRFSKGNPAPNFKGYDLDGKEVSLQDFKGKTVYVDIWATWCAPCIRELPHYEKLKAKYQNNKNIVFASVSIDSQEKKWRDFVTSKQSSGEMSGIQLLNTDAYKPGGISNIYDIKGIPRFLLIDKQGNIITTYAPRPSSKELEELLQDYVN